MVLDLVVFWRNQLDQSTPCVSTELNKKGIIWGFPSVRHQEKEEKQEQAQLTLE
ncbi:hypothetical protein I6M53_13710 [Shewanella algae]|nr:hypothetical protein [Shewanella algae]